MEIVQRRAQAMHRGARASTCEPNPYYDAYYGLIDFEFWARKYIGEDVVKYVKANVHPLDIVFRLAEDHGIVLLNGSGFDAPNWSVRVSFANLDDDVYDDIGRGVRAVARSYYQAYQLATGKTAGNGRGAAAKTAGGNGRGAAAKTARGAKA